MNKKAILNTLIKGLYIIFLGYLVIMSPMLFLFIGLHELSHLLIGIALGYRMKKITMLPFGFSLCFKEDYIKPIHNIIISLMGPLTNLIFFGIFYYLFLSNGSTSLYNISVMNLGLSIFNLLPIGFLDGGRVVKSILAMYVSLFCSNLIISLNGIIFGCIMLVVSLLHFKGLGNFIIILIGLSIVSTSLNDIKSMKMNIIKDVIYKRFQNIKPSCIIRKRYYSSDMRIFNILKRFNFNVSYNIISESEETLSDNDIINYYFTKGNITLRECFIEHRRNIDVEYKRRDSSKC